MPLVRVADIVVVHRNVDIPSECPSCSAQLRRDDGQLAPALRRYSYSMSYTHGQLASAGDADKIDRTVEDGLVIPIDDRDFEWAGDSADSDLLGAAYQCVMCCKEVAVGKLHLLGNALPLASFFGKLIEKHGWSERTTLHLATFFIDATGLGELFREFLDEMTKPNG